MITARNHLRQRLVSLADVMLYCNKSSIIPSESQGCDAAIPEEFLLIAQQHCAARGARLTELRQQVLGLVLARGGVVKTYQVLTDLQKPPAARRAAHRIPRAGFSGRARAVAPGGRAEWLYCLPAPGMPAPRPAAGVRNL